MIVSFDVLLFFIIAIIHSPSPPPTRTTTMKMSLFLLLFQLVATTLSFCNALSNPNPTNSNVRVAVYQPRTSPLINNKNNPLALLTQAADALRVASVHGVSLVLFPELFLPNAAPATSLFTKTKSSDSELKSVDRDGYELNIIGNLCAELGVACVTGYVEQKHESEGGAVGVFSSAAIFNCDGSRAGNCRRITSTKSSASKDNSAFLRGHALVETLPISIRLSTLSKMEKEIKVGVLLGDDVLVPEQCRHVVRSGAEALFVLSSFGGRHETKDYARVRIVVRHVLPARAVENSVPILFSNYVGNLEERHEDAAAGDSFSFIGSSTILDAFGEELVRAPDEENGDMPSDGGYLLPCEAGELYAVDLDLDGAQTEDRNFAMEYAKGWDLSPSIQGGGMTKKTMDKTMTQKNGSRGFGAAASSSTPSTLITEKKQKSEKRKKQKRSKYYPWAG